MQSPTPATANPAYNALLAKIEWKETGAPGQTVHTAPDSSLQINLDELLAALAAMQDAQRRRRH
jgi:hypothetical protein